MLIEFSAENFRSIKGRVTLSMIAAKLRSRDDQLDRDNVSDVNPRLSLLRSAVIYGANASGKSNILKAFHFMKDFVRDSVRQQDEDKIPVDPFHLDITTIDQPSTFEAVFLIDGIQHRYGFSVMKDRVVAEWLYYIPNRREVELFTRDYDTLHIAHSFREGRGLKELELDLKNKLLLSVIAGLKSGEKAKQVRHWFVNRCDVLEADDDRGYSDFTVLLIATGILHSEIESLVKHLDLDINKLSLNQKLRPSVPLPSGQSIESMKGSAGRYRIKNVHDEHDLVWELRTHHPVRDEGSKVVGEMVFDANISESEGTQKIIALAGPLIYALAHGKVLFLDEIDARLHPVITAAIVRLFNSPETNPRSAQLICVTHDTNLLDRHLFRRDQIYFVEKDAVAATHLYSLADFKLEGAGQKGKTVRNDASFEKNYIQGRYGAIPFLGNIEQWFIEQFQKEAPLAAADSVLPQVPS